MAVEMPLGTNAQMRTARIAGAAFPISMALIAYSNYGIREPLSVDGNLPETVRRIAAAESLARASVVVDLAYCLALVILASALYTVLKSTGRLTALVAAVSQLVYAACMLLVAFSFFQTVHLASDPAYTSLLGAGQVQAIVKLNYAAAWDQYYVGLPFWALSTMLFGWLWLKSRSIPAGIAVASIIAAAWCLICGIAYLLTPDFANYVNVSLFDMPMVLASLVLSGWLVFRGTRHTTP